MESTWVAGWCWSLGLRQGYSKQRQIGLWMVSPAKGLEIHNFDNDPEWTMGKALGAAEFEKRQKKHWSTFITENDFKEIKALGLNFVRIPIGYWAIIPNEGDPYVQGAYGFLAKALDWAKSHGLMVIIDLHGAPGSQNGFDNSGQRGNIGWNEGDTVAQTYAVLNKIRADHANHPAVAVIEVLNEPLAPALGKDVVEGFSSQAYDNLQGAPVAVMVEDAFDTIDSWTDFGKGKSNLILGMLTQAST